MTRPLRKFSIYGFVWETDLYLSSYLIPAEGQSDVVLYRIRDLERPPANCLFTSPIIRNGSPFLKVYGTDQKILLRYPSLVDIVVTPQYIHYLPTSNSDMALIETQCLGPASALWLELNNILALHASAVVVDDAAVVFFEVSGSGKSTLTATFITHQHALLTDDILAVNVTPQTVWGRPGYPQLRLFPEVADHFVAKVDRLAPAHSPKEKKRIPVGGSGLGAFCDRQVAISHIYVLNRVQEDGMPITIRDLEPTDALRTLLRGSSAAHTAEALNLQPLRLPQLARIAETVPIRSLTYPCGLHRLNDVYHAVVNDIEATRGQRFH